LLCFLVHYPRRPYHSHLGRPSAAMATTGRRLLCCCLLAGARASLEDVEAMVQMTAQSSKPTGLIRLGDDDPETMPQQRKGNFFNTLALGAQADGDSAMAQVLDGVGNMMDSMKPAETQPPRAILDGSKDDPLEQAARGLSTWGKKMDNWFDEAQRKPAEDPKQILAGLGQAVTRALPAEFRELGGQIRGAAKVAKQGLEGAAKGLSNLETKVKDMEASATEEQKQKVRDAVGNFIQKRVIEGDHESRDAKNLRKLVHWFRQDSGEKVGPSWQGINKQVVKINKFIKDPLAARQEQMAAKKAREEAAAAPPEVPAAQQQQPPQTQVAPEQQPQPRSMAPAHLPVVGPMGYSNYQYGYPMAPPPMMQQPPMGGMPPYPMQQQQLR